MCVYVDLTGHLIQNLTFEKMASVSHLIIKHKYMRLYWEI